MLILINQNLHVLIQLYCFKKTEKEKTVSPHRVLDEGSCDVEASLR